MFLMTSPLLGRFLVAFNLQPATGDLQSVVCSLRSAVCSLQSAVCGLQSAVCSLQSANVMHRLNRAFPWPHRCFAAMWTTPCVLEPISKDSPCFYLMKKASWWNGESRKTERMKTFFSHIWYGMIAILLPLNCQMVPVCNFQWVTAGINLLQLPLICTRNTNTYESFVPFVLCSQFFNIYLCTISLYCPYFTFRRHFLLLVKKGDVKTFRIVW